MLFINIQILYEADLGDSKVWIWSHFDNKSIVCEVIETIPRYLCQWPVKVNTNGNISAQSLCIMPNDIYANDLWK